MQDWTDFYTATAGAAAALIGLIFVGLSISLTKILTISSLPNRALTSIVLLVCILVISILALVPQDGIQWLGAEILITSLGAWLIVTRSDVKNLKQIESQFKQHNFFLSGINQVAILTYIACGILMLMGIGKAEYLIVPAFILSFIKSASDSWVLLIEINR